MTQPDEVSVLSAHGIDFAGLWYAVPGGAADLPLDRWRGLAGAALATDGLEPVLVTFSKDAEQLVGALEGSGVA